MCLPNFIYFKCFLMPIKQIILCCFLCSSVCQNLNAQTSKINFTSNEKTAVAVNKFYNYHFVASDSLQSTVQYSAINLPQWLSFNQTNQTITGTAKHAGQYPVKIVATSSKDTAYQRFMLTVTNKETTNILCLGNSITNGTSTYNSYRRALWQMLHNGNYNIDMIGSWSKHHMGGEMPNADFDLDHEGHSGWTIGDILNPPSWDKNRGNLKTWLTVYKPNIVLL